MYFIGSTAIVHWFNDFYRPANKDCDVLLTNEELNQDKDELISHIYTHYPDYTKLKIEFHNIEPIQNPKYYEDNYLIPDALYTLKLSHSLWDIHWGKTSTDIQYLADRNCKVIESLFDELYQYWIPIHRAKRANLNTSNNKFFTSTVDRQYEHDFLHELMAYYDKPMFTKIKKDLSKAMCSREMFENLSFEDRLKTCREELYVTALERFIIPKDGKINYIGAYKSAMRLLVTSMSKGWFPQFIMRNIHHLSKPEKNYAKEFYGKLEEHKKNNTIRYVVT